MCRFLGGLICFFLLFVLLKGEELAPVLALRTFERSNWAGLPQNTVSALEQDFRGILWIGTADGVATFDGVELKAVSDEIGAPSQGMITSIQSNQQRVIVSSNFGLFIYNYQKWERVNAPALLVRTHLDRRGQIWALTVDGQLLQLVENEETKFWQKPSPPYPERCQLLYFSSDDLLLTLEKNQLFQIDQAEKKSIPLPENLEERITTIFISRNKQILIGTERGKIFVCDQEKQRWQQIALPSLPSGQISRVVEDSYGFFWIAGSFNGLIRGKIGSNWQILTSRNGLITATISSLLVDREGLLWIGYNGAGLQQLLSRSWLHRNTVEVTPSELQPVSVLGITRKQSTGFLAALFNFGIWDWNGQKMIRYSKDDGLLDDVRLAVEVRPGVIWAACRFGIYEKEGAKKFKKVFNLSRGFVTSFLQLPSGDWLAGTSTNGLLRFKRSAGWDYADDLNRELADPQIRTMALCANNLWVATLSGLTIFHPHGVEKFILNNFPDLPAAINAICQLKNGDVWVGGSGGVTIFRQKGGRERVSKPELLPGKTVYAIGQNRKSGEIWLTGSDGITVIRDDRWQRYGRSNGLLEAECNRDGLLINDDGTVLVGTMRSLAFFSPHEEFKPNFQLQPYWLELPIFESKKEDLLLLPAKLKEIYFRWHTPFLRPHTVSYRLKISPLFNDFSPWRGENSLRIAALPPGKYALTVQARIDDGEREYLSAPLTIEFSRVAGFKETIWFKIIFLSCFGGLISLFFYLQLRHLRLRINELDQILMQRNKDLASSNQTHLELDKKLKEVAVQDQLTGLINRREIEERLKDYLSLMERQQKELGLLLIDIDYFKQINDTFGYLIGDQVLKKISNCLERTFRESDLCSRAGGDEFLIVLPATNRREMEIVLKRFFTNLSRLKVDDGQGGELTITVSGGAENLIPGKEETVDRLFSLLEKALDQAKKSGRERIVWVENLQ